MTETADCVVVGAGVVGLAIARALALAGREVIVLEAESAIGTATSSRNSEVIHAGIYYRPATLKARLCLQGREFLYRYCRERGIPHRRLGKLIIATDDFQLPELHRLHAQALANGVDDLRLVESDEVRAMEPSVRCVAGLHSPSTGIIDSHALMLAYQGEAEEHGASLALRSPVLGGRVGRGGIELDVGGASPLRLRCRTVINAAGLHAHELARRIEGVPAGTVPKVHYAKGVYFALQGRSPFSRLVYPVHERDLFSVHVTLDLQGRARFGPDVEWVETIDYTVDPGRAEAFYAAIRRYWAELPDGALQPAYAGIRPKLTAGGSHGQDFMIVGPDVHGVPGLVQLFGMESPGLTASAAIGEHVAALIA
jgi:L-2-hydroxyglutarate oxidase LhgO